MTWIDINQRKPEDKDLVKKFTWFFPNGDQETHSWAIAQALLSGPVISQRPTHWRECFEPPKKVRWRPENGGHYYGINQRGNIFSGHDYIINSFLEIMNFLGFYRTREEAEAMRDKIRAFVTEQIGEVE